MSRSMLFRMAGVSAVVAGLVFILLQFIHPDETIANVTTRTWKAVHVLTMVMTVLAFAGVLGIYLRQVRVSSPQATAARLWVETHQQIWRRAS